MTALNDLQGSVTYFVKLLNQNSPGSAVTVNNASTQLQFRTNIGCWVIVEDSISTNTLAATTDGTHYNYHQPIFPISNLQVKPDSGSQLENQSNMDVRQFAINPVCISDNEMRKAGGGLPQKTVYPFAIDVVGTASTIGAHYNGDVNSPSYVGQSDFANGYTPTVSSTLPSITWSVPMRLLMGNRGSIYNKKDKAWYSPVQCSILMQMLNPAQLGWVNTNATNPASTTGASALASYTVSATTQYFQALELNPAICQAYLNKTMAGYIEMVPQTVAASSSFTPVVNMQLNLQQLLNNGAGKYLQYVFGLMVQNTNNFSQYYDRANQATTSGIGYKIASYQYLANSYPLSQFLLQTTSFDDYVFNREKLKDSAAEGLRNFYQNGVLPLSLVDGKFVDRWSPDDEGLLLNTQMPINLQINASSTLVTGVASAMYMFLCTMRECKVSSQGFNLV